MKWVCLVGVTLACVFTFAQAQSPRTEWTRFRPSSPDTTRMSTDILISDDGACYVPISYRIGGLTASRVELVKYLSDGTMQWQRYYVTPSGQGISPNRVMRAGATDIYLAGTIEVGTIWLPLVVKYSADGDTLWSRELVDSTGTSVWIRAWETDPDGNIYFCGRTASATETQDWYVAKYDSNGAYLWSDRYQGNPDDYEDVSDIAVDNLGNVYATGVSRGFAAALLTTTKYSPTGAVEWRRDFSSIAASQDAGNDIVVDGDGNVVVVGTTRSDSGGFNLDWIVLKYTPSGDTLWTRKFGGAFPVDDMAYHVQVDSENNIYVAGDISLLDYGISDIGVLKYDPAGQLLWQRSYDGTEHEDEGVVEIEVDSHQGVVILAQTNESDIFESGDLTIRRYSPDGLAVWTKSYMAAVDVKDVPIAFGENPNGGWTVTGWSVSGSKSYFTFTNRYSDHVCGDANSSQSLTISDVVYVISYCFANGPAPNPLLSGDANCNGAVSVSDAVLLINYIFAGGAMPCAACP